MRIAWIAATALTCVVSSASCVSASPPPQQTLLPPDIVLDLAAVNTFFPDITHLAQTGPDKTAQGNPTATRSVFYETNGGTKRVTISVDRYRDPSAASDAYKRALQKSEAVRGFKLLKVPNLAQRTFAGTVTMNGETHVGMGVLSGNTIVGATTARYDASASLVSSLVSMTRIQVAHLGK
jgi:hypothetical protein